jgi:hypothetical protein
MVMALLMMCSDGVVPQRPSKGIPDQLLDEINAQT